MTDYGKSLRCLTDLDPLLGSTEGDETMIQALVHRLFTPPGTLLSDPSAVTLDAREFLSKAIGQRDLPVIAAQCQACLLDDERVVKVVILPSFADSVLTLDIRGIGANGPFALTIAVTNLTVELLSPV